MTENGHDMIKSYSDLAGISIYYNYFGGADILIAKTQRANAASYLNGRIIGSSIESAVITSNSKACFMLFFSVYKMSTKCLL